MKKYRFLEAGEKIEVGDEIHLSGWGVIHPDDDNLIGYEVDDDGVGFYRRPIPFKGKTAFLVNYSPIIRVEVDCTGLSEEEIYEKVAGAAQFKFFTTASEYREFFHENIDWENTKVDEECPAEEEYLDISPDDTICCGDELWNEKRQQWTPCTFVVGWKRSMTALKIRRPKWVDPANVYGEGEESGEPGHWVATLKPDGRFRVERIENPINGEPLEFDDTAWFLARLAGYKLDGDGYVVEWPKGWDY